MMITNKFCTSDVLMRGHRKGHSALHPKITCAFCAHERGVEVQVRSYHPQDSTRPPFPLEKRVVNELCRTSKVSALLGENRGLHTFEQNDDYKLVVGAIVLISSSLRDEWDITIRSLFVQPRDLKVHGNP